MFYVLDKLLLVKSFFASWEKVVAMLRLRSCLLCTLTFFLSFYSLPGQVSKAQKMSLAGKVIKTPFML